MSESVLAQIAALKHKSLPELRALWKELFDRDAPPLGRRYLEDRLAFRLQELQLGGLSDRARCRLDVLADQLEPKAARRRDPGRPIAGTQLRREWKGAEHVVTVREHDFEYDGRPYRSLIRELAVRHVASWAGVDLGRGPAAPTPENIAAVMELYPVGERFFQEFTLRQVLLNAAKNGCGPSAAGTSSPVEGPNTAEPAARTVCRAPDASREPTGGSAPIASTP